MVQKNMMALKTRRLTLAPCCPDDVPDFIALEQDREVMRYLNGGKPVDRTFATGSELFLLPEGTEKHVWTARRRDNGVFVGWFCLWPETSTLGELGYRLRRQEWGQGFASEGGATLVNWGFSHLEFNEIIAVTMTVNNTSRRVLEKLGMKFVRKMDVDWPYPFPGTEEGEVEYVLTRAEWQKVQG